MKDEETCLRIRSLSVNFFSYYLGQGFESWDDTVRYVRSRAEGSLACRK